MEVKGYRVRSSGGKLYAVVDWTDDSGRRRQRSKRIADEREALEFYIMVKSGAEPIKKDGSEPFGEYAARYFAGRLERHEYERSTYATNLKHVRAWERSLGRKPLSKVTEEDVRKAIAGWFRDGRDATTVDKRITALQEVYRFAVKDGACGKDPFEAVRRPRKQWRELNGVNDSGALADVVAAIGRLPLEWPKVAFSIALYTGMRRGEIAALRWKDLDLGCGTLWVRRAIGSDDDGTYVKPPKSNKPRDVPVPSSLSSLLDAWRLECMYSHGITPESAIVCDCSGKPLNPDCMTHAFTAFARFNGLKGAAGRRLTLHDLRHTTATVLIANGADVKTVQSVLGHSSAAVTLDMYASADSGAKRKAAALLDAAL